jgi:hypothetical protein
MRLLRTLRAANNEIITLLKASVIGTPGSSMLYRHKTVEQRISYIKTPFFIALQTRLSLVAVCCFCLRDTVNCATSLRSFYIRYFSFKENYRAQRQSWRSEKSGDLRGEIKAFFDSEQPRLSSSQKYFNYAYVDPRNTRSLLLCQEFGFQEVRRFSTFVFSRIHPAVPAGFAITKISSADVAEVARLLLERYADFNMASFGDLTLSDRYYVVKDPSGRIMAGAHVVPGHWKIYRMNNTANTILLMMASKVPLLNRLINTEFHFLAVDALYFTEGEERYTEVLLSSLLKIHKHYNAFIPADNDSPLSRHLQRLNLGLVSKISKQVTTSVICRFNGFSSEEIKQFKQYPAYVSALDIT